MKKITCFMVLLMVVLFNVNVFADVTTSISTAEYDPSKNIMHIAGFVDGVNETVNASIYKDGHLVKNIPVKICNGFFNKLFSLTEEGIYTINLGGYAETEVSISPSPVRIGPSIIEGVSVYLDWDMDICISGKIKNFANNENITVIIVPSGSAIEPNNFLYINQIEIEEDGSFFDEAELYSLERKVDIYIGATNTVAEKSSLTYDGVYKVKTLDYDDDEVLSVSAVMYNTTDTDKNANIYIAQYDESGMLIDICILPIVVKNSTTNGQLFELTAEKKINTASYKAFVWDMTDGGLKPLCNAVNFDKILLNKFTAKQSFHTDIMKAYLNDSYTSIGDYADGKTALDAPIPITFRWEWIGKGEAPSEYTLLISENPDMKAAQEYTVNTESCDVYNLKSNTDYYWAVSAKDARGNVIISRTETMKTEDKAPRNLKIDGVPNARDIGGWDTSDGKQVKQGYLYRSFRLSYISNGKFKRVITDDGIRAMRELGIKSEIDLRQEGEMPFEYAESVLGSDVNYFRIPLGYQDYLSNNKDSIKEIFAKLSEPNNYPMVYHCAAGADRTAVITYLINGLLGVSKEDLFRDYLITNFAITDGHFRPIDNITDVYVKTIDEYRGSTLSEKIYNYLNEVVEVPSEQLDFIISFLK